MVDDDRMVLLLLDRILSAEGYQVVCASDGKQALELLEEDKFGLVITDVVLPGRLNGMDVLAAARRIDPAYQVVVVTGFYSVEEAQRAFKLGAVDYLPKPFNTSWILPTVKRALRAQGATTSSSEAKLREETSSADSL